MNITPNKLTIGQLFATTNERFVVPSYQRRYAWGRSQIGALFDDIDMLRDDDGHLFGMIILHTDYHTGGVNKPEVVDGQQRLTTLTILLRAIRDRFSKLKNEDKVQELDKMLSCSDLTGQRTPKLELGDLDNPDLLHLLAGDFAYTFTNSKIIGAYRDFEEWLSEYEPEDLLRFYFKLTNVAVIIRLDVGMAQDAYKLFETINNRGLRLSPTDIIKNFLLGHAAKIGPDVLADTKSLWSEIITNLDGIDSNDFFRQYMESILHARLSLNELVPEIKKYYMKHIEHADILGEFDYYASEPVFEDLDEEDDDIQDQDWLEEGLEEYAEDEDDGKMSLTEFLAKIRTTSAVYRKIALERFDNVKINRHIGYLNRILSKPTYIFLMHLLQRELPPNTVVQALKVLQTFMLRRHICESRTNQHDAIFATMMSKLDEPDIVSAIKEHLAEHLPSDDDFKLSFPRHKFKGVSIERAKYVLEILEYEKSGNTGELVVASANEVHLEHIIPQKITTQKSKQIFGDWEEYLGEGSSAKHKKYVNQIGNMTLLAEALNIQAYNNPFAKKKGSYRKSNFLITKELSEQNDFKFYHVDKRGDELAASAVRIWSF